MKLTTLLLFIAIMQVSASSLAQKVTIKAKDAQLSNIFQQIRTQTGYDFAYTTKTLESANPVTIDVKNEELADVLEQIFEGQPLSYTVQDKFVTVSLKLPSLLDKLKSALNPDKIDIHGKVVGDDGLPLSGATVIVKGSNNSTITDAKGEFKLKSVSPNATAVITFIGYNKKEIPVQMEMGIIKMTQASSQLDAVEVIAYGQTSERLSVGNINTVNAKTIEQQPVNNPLLALEGQMPGLTITQTSGLPGAGVNVYIQGQNSIASGNDPLYVIDGVPYFSEMLPGLGGMLGTSGRYVNNTGGGPYSQNGNPLSYINPSDIESITLLKDASATSIYGSRAANGAILITTKKGKAGDTRVDFSLQNGYGEVTRFLPLMNTQQYLQMMHEAYSLDGLTYPSITANPNDPHYSINGFWDTTKNTNWQKVLLGGQAQYMDYNASVSGGTNNTQFLVSATYHRETTVFPGDFNDQKGNIHFSINNTSPNQKFKIQMTGSYMADADLLPNGDLTKAALQTQPDAPPLYSADGGINWAPTPSGKSSFAKNPIAPDFDTYRATTSTLNSHALISYELLPGLLAATNLGFTDQRVYSYVLLPSAAIQPESLSHYTPDATYNNSDQNSWDVEPQLSYTKAIGKGTLKALVGATFFQQNSNQASITGTGYPSDQVLQDLTAATTLYPSNALISEYKYNALLARIGYNWSDTYLIDLSANRDGSSRFGENNEFHTFWSAGAGWVFSNLDFIKNNFKFLAFGKLKTSYGTTGNDQIGDYQFIPTYYFTSPAIPYQGVSASQPSGLPNPNLEWELTRKFNAGIDLSFFKERVTLNADYYMNRSSNQLLGYYLPSISGFTSIIENFPATVQNYGWELQLHTVNVKSRSFSWSSSINLTVPENKLVAFPNIEQSSYASTYTIGKPITSIKVYHFLGVNPQTGVYQFEAANGTTTSSPQYGIDQYETLNLAPKFNGGFQNSLGYKNFHLDFLFQFVKQLGPNYSFGAYPGQATLPINQPEWVLDSWQKPGDVKPVQRFSTTYNYLTQGFGASMSDAAYSDASFIRLKNLSFSYQLAEQFARKLGMRNCNVFVQGQNLLTITNFKGMDPENESIQSLPPLRVLSAGIRAGF